MIWQKKSLEEKSDISAKLRMYEQRLAEAKETATRIWN